MSIGGEFANRYGNGTIENHLYRRSYRQRDIVAAFEQDFARAEACTDQGSYSSTKASSAKRAERRSRCHTAEDGGCVLIDLIDRLNGAFAICALI